MFLILALILLFALPSPWGLIGFAVSLVLFVGELTFWHRRVRRQPKLVGKGTLIGANGVAVSPCRPEGQARVGGEIWSARCDSGVEAGAAVTVVGVDGLTLIVRRA